MTPQNLINTGKLNVTLKAEALFFVKGIDC